MDALPRSTAEWMRIPPTRVELHQLHPTQDVHPDHVQAKMVRWWTSHSGDVYPHCTHRDGRLIILDGHHRLARARLLGQRWAWVRIAP